jgi:histidine triad (HIT) family protein
MILKDENCIFCKIASGAIPSYKLYEDDLLLCFLDVFPIVSGHTLVIPKGHYRNVLEIPPDVLAAIHLRIPKLAAATIAGVKVEACHVLTNSGVEAGQTVDHLHYHIIPRFEGDGYKMGWPSGKLDPTHAARLQLSIGQALKDAP